MSVRGDQARQRSLEELSSGAFDLLVIGAGIVGARVAFEAARAGLKVALVDAGDFGGATSSASGKLVHGGLRYLRSGKVRLVREARGEQRLLSGRVAPHLTRRMPLLLATGERGFSKFSTIAAGPLAYWSLGGFHAPAPSLIAARQAEELAPPLRIAGPCALLEEAVTDDGRLTLATVRAAVGAGAVAMNYMRVVELERTRHGISGALLEGRSGEGSIRVDCRAVVNATGPWLDQVRLLEDPRR